MTSKIVWSSVRAKIKKEHYLELENYCKSSGITISSYIRTLIERDRPCEVSLKKAGTNVLRFNPLDDEFVWEIKFDDDTTKLIAEELSLNFLENLKCSIEKALLRREEHIKKKLDDSIVIPIKLNKLKGRGEYVKS